MTYGLDGPEQNTISTRLALNLAQFQSRARDRPNWPLDRVMTANEPNEG